MPTSSDDAPLSLDDLRALTTEDGSTTYELRDSGVSYRSRKGAHTESELVFVTHSGIATRPSPWRVVELGFGVTTNFRLTARRALDAGATLHYTAVEHRPAPSAILDDMEEDVPTEMARAALDAARADGFAQFSRADLHLTVHALDWEALTPQADSAHAVYFDPFGPVAQPDSWTQTAYDLAATWLATDGRVVTYSAAGHVRRGFGDAGLWVAVAPGPPGKRDVTIAAHTREALEDLPYTRIWEPRV